MVKRWVGILLVAAVGACGDDGGNDGTGGGNDEGGGGQAESPPALKCQQACDKVEQICPGTWTTVDACSQQCLDEPFSESSIDCVLSQATDCDGLDTCSD